MKTFIAEFKLPDGRSKYMGFWADNKALAQDHAWCVSKHSGSFPAASFPNGVMVKKVTMVAKADFDDKAAGVLLDSPIGCLKQWVIR